MPKPPFTKEEMFEELRLVVRVMANHVAKYGNIKVAEMLTGFESEGWGDPYTADPPSKFDLSRFDITHYMGPAYDYAFQVGRPSSFGDDTAQDINEFRHSAILKSSDGESSPMADPDSKCRIVVDTAFARWLLESSLDLTIRELSLLSGMKEPAVRNSLSAEGIKVNVARQQSGSGTVDGNLAYGWLRKRRAFIDSINPDTIAINRRREYRVVLRDYGLAGAFKEILEAEKRSPADVASKAGVEPAFVESLKAGRPGLDLEAARRVAETLDLDIPSFVGAVVEAALRVSEPSAPLLKGP